MQFLFTCDSTCCRGNTIAKEFFRFFGGKILKMARIGLILAFNVNYCFTFGIKSKTSSPEPNFS